MRHTKIFVTIGRLYNSEEYLQKFIDGGADYFRLNMAHQDHDWHRDMIRKLRKAIGESGRDIRIESDISGPKVRTGNNPEGSYWIELSEGEKVIINTSSPQEGKIHLPFPGIHDMLAIGSRIFIDDASVQLEVLSKEGDDIVCKSLLNSKLGGNRTVVVPGKDFGLPAVTEKDRDDMDFLARQNIDCLGFSMVNSSEEIEGVRDIFSRRGAGTKIIAKIETPQSVVNMDGIIKASDAVIVARGDMGVFMPIEQVPRIQYEIIRKCRAEGKLAIVATEMLHSMKRHVIPSRAEVHDIYMAVSSGAGAVMLTGETTEGLHPLRSLDYMRRIVEEAEARPIELHGLRPAWV